MPTSHFELCRRSKDGPVAHTHRLYIQSWRLHEANAEVVNDEGGDAGGDAVLAQGAHYQHPLEVGEFSLPVTYKRGSNMREKVTIPTSGQREEPRRPGRGLFSGSLLVNQSFHSSGYSLKDSMMPWKPGSCSRTETLSQLEFTSQPEQGFSICSSLSSTCSQNIPSNTDLRTQRFCTLSRSLRSKALSYNSSSEEEVVLIHVEFSRRLHDPDAHLEAEEQLVDFEQTSTGVPAQPAQGLSGMASTSAGWRWSKKRPQPAAHLYTAYVW